MVKSRKDLFSRRDWQSDIGIGRPKKKMKEKREETEKTIVFLCIDSWIRLFFFFSFLLQLLYLYADGFILIWWFIFFYFFWFFFFACEIVRTLKLVVDFSLSIRRNITCRKNKKFFSFSVIFSICLEITTL